MPDALSAATSDSSDTLYFGTLVCIFARVFILMIDSRGLIIGLVTAAAADEEVFILSFKASPKLKVIKTKTIIIVIIL